MKTTIVQQKATVLEFVRYCADMLELKGPININLVVGDSRLVGSAGCMDRYTGTILVKIKNRAIADILRTVSHEMTHLKQKQMGRIDRAIITTAEEEQALEDEANTMSGRFVRWFGQEHPEIYKDIE